VSFHRRCGVYKKWVDSYVEKDCPRWLAEMLVTWSIIGGIIMSLFTLYVVWLLFFY